MLVRHTPHPRSAKNGSQCPATWDRHLPCVENNGKNAVNGYPGCRSVYMPAPRRSHKLSILTFLSHNAHVVKTVDLLRRIYQYFPNLRSLFLFKVATRSQGPLRTQASIRRLYVA